MSYGVELYSQTGSSLTFSTGFTFVDTISVSAYSGGSRAYTDHTGFQFYLCPVLNELSIVGLSLPTVDYTNGYPVVFWSSGPTPMIIYVMGR